MAEPLVVDHRNAHASQISRRSRPPLLRLRSDEQLVALLREGNTAAFEVLASRYQARLLAHCHHIVGSHEDAEDVVQEVFAAAFRAIMADERPINVRPWLYLIARNRSLNHLRRAQPIGEDAMEAELADGGESTADKVERAEEFRILVTDVQRLPETQRTALLLREIDGLSLEQVADAMQTTVPSVKSLLVRARVALAEAGKARSRSSEKHEQAKVVDDNAPELVMRLAGRSSPASGVETEVRGVSKLLFGNRLRLEVAAAVATEPTGQVYGRALAERLEINDNQAAGELKALEAAGLLRRLPQKDRRGPILFERLPSAYWELAATFYEEVASRTTVGSSHAMTR